MKYTRFRDIPQFTRTGSWECYYRVDWVWAEMDRWKGEYGLDLDPDFQRLHVWTEAQQIAWLEFFFRGGKTGRTIYFNCPEFGGRGARVKASDRGMVLVDGKQRLEAIRKFYADELRVFGSLASEFEDKADTMGHGIRLNVNDLPTRADVLRWYIEQNSGGTPHTEAEIEKARKLLEASQ